MEKKLEKYYRERTNVRLKYAAYISIGIGMMLMLALMFLMDKLGDTAILLMRGFAGVFVILFVVLAGILVYRVNAAYHRDKAKSNRN